GPRSSVFLLFGRRALLRPRRRRRGLALRRPWAQGSRAPTGAGAPGAGPVALPHHVDHRAGCVL
ncbi:MAG: hypothetical protein AVDCRST_MAG10-3523, partial [uncultured Acidimicrobiales bacterium]